jgi:MoaA/NifB/PqqE/SkfB family radical SAM enzyme
MSEKLFCSKPFQWLEVSGWAPPKGDVYLCCPTWLETPVGNLQKQSVEEVWNGETAQAIRESIHDGSFSYCNANRCAYLKSRTGPVQPAASVTDPKLRQAIDERLTVLPWGPQEINCAFDKSCNLSCPTCRHERIIETDQADPIRLIRNKIEREALPGARYLNITGSGDAFGSPYFNEWLRTMQFEATPKLEHIHLHTNGLLWTPRMWSQIPQMVRDRILSAEISIDAATAETYAVNRRGGSFSRLLENLSFIQSLRREGPLKWLRFSMVVQENNFHEMPDFVRLGQRFGTDSVYFGQLVNWGTFSDEEFKSRAIHFKTHKRHSELVSILREPIFDEKEVFLGNLLDLRPPLKKRSYPLSVLSRLYELAVNH